MIYKLVRDRGNSQVWKAEADGYYRQLVVDKQRNTVKVQDILIHELGTKYTMPELTVSDAQAIIDILTKKRGK